MNIFTFFCTIFSKLINYFYFFVLGPTLGDVIIEIIHLFGWKKPEPVSQPEIRKTRSIADYYEEELPILPVSSSVNFLNEELTVEENDVLEQDLLFPEPVVVENLEEIKKSVSKDEKEEVVMYYTSRKPLPKKITEKLTKLSTMYGRVRIIKYNGGNETYEIFQVGPFEPCILENSEFHAVIATKRKKKK